MSTHDVGREIRIRDMQSEDEEYVGSCSHVRETHEWTASCRRRLLWLREQHRNGLRAKVALVSDRHAGFLYVMPIEIARGPVGRDLMVIQCLNVPVEMKHQGIGRALVAAAEEETHRQQRRGLAVTAFHHDFWFMPAPFFERCGFAPVSRRDNAAILWKSFHASARPPDFVERNYRFHPTAGKVTVDLFWSQSCLTTDTEAERVREVAAEFGDAVELREFCSDDPEVRSRHGIFRAIFINGEEVGWGYEAPKEGLREAIGRSIAEASAAPGGAVAEI